MKPQQLSVGQKAKSILFECGWRQGPAHNDIGQVCMVEALIQAVISEPAPVFGSDIFGLTNEMICSLGFRSTPEVIEWNDKSGRTFEQVLKRLDRI